jgi:hypothetical protein
MLQQHSHSFRLLLLLRRRLLFRLSCRQWAFWKGEVRAMIGGACEAWLRDYRMDGLRFDSIKDVPMDMVQVGSVTSVIQEPCPLVTLVFLEIGDISAAGQRLTKADGCNFKACTRCLHFA